MKIVLTTVSPNLDAEVDPRFGRAANLLLVDTDTLEWKAESNPGAGASGGAGIRAAQFVADQNAQAVISGDFGPNAFEALQAAGITMYIYGDCQNAHQVIERFKAGQLQQVGGPTRGEGNKGYYGKNA
jgi:predicted Fe-Mo cluster-binding NifX family protein